MSDVLDKRKQVAQQCLAVAHLARALAQVNEELAGVHADSILDIVGDRTARQMEILGDMLNGMDACDDEDETFNPTFEAAHKMFPQAPDLDGSARIAKLTALLRVPLEAYGPWDSNVLADDHPVQITVTLGWIRKVRAAVQK